MDDDKTVRRPSRRVKKSPPPSSELGVEQGPGHHDDLLEVGTTAEVEAADAPASPAEATAEAMRPALAAALKNLATCDLTTALPIALMAVLDLVVDHPVQREMARAHAEHLLRLRNGNDARHAERAVAAVFGPRPTSPRAPRTDGGGSGPPPAVGVIAFEDVEPTADAVDLDDLLTEINDFIAARVHLPDVALIVCALWVLHTYLADVVEQTPYLVINSPVKRCGKSTLLRGLTLLVHRAQPAAHATPAALFRLVAKHHPTLLLDESDRWLVGKTANLDLVALVNAGNVKGTPALRTVGDHHDVAAFDAYCPKALAGIGDLPDTIADRGIRIAMRRKPTAVRVQRMTRADTVVARALRARMTRWADDHRDELADVDLDTVWLPEGLNDRLRDCWAPLMAIASFAGPAWVRDTIDAAAGLARDDEDEADGVALLRDLNRIFLDAGETKLLSTTICERLATLDDASTRWGAWHLNARDNDRWIQPRDLAKLLRPFDIRPKTVREQKSERRGSGYDAEDLVEAVTCYVPPGAEGEL